MSRISRKSEIKNENVGVQDDHGRILISRIASSSVPGSGSAA
jgi:hypothetical protein